MDKIIYEKVGLRLKQARELRKITLEEAGKKVGVHKSTVLRWENGETEKFKISTLETLANFYNVNPAWLMGYDVPMERNINEKQDDFKYASYTNRQYIDATGLSEEEIEELQKIVEYARKKKQLKEEMNKENKNG